MPGRHAGGRDHQGQRNLLRRRPKLALALAGTAFFAMAGIGVTAAAASQAGAPYSCVTTQLPHGTCGPYDNYPQIHIAGPGAIAAPYVDQNDWSGYAGYQSTLSANSPGDWQAKVTVPAGADGSVKSFINSGWGIAWPPQPIDSYSSITSSYTESFTHSAQVRAWAAYDLWFN